ncbi:short-chain dehydrogenase [Mycolicibacterium anyangense]|uniref:Short-chain dehydrogenase n=2 Tax=Mycolicibacterium anyangense TaxID=1431246 RepID=A0A6N4W9S9_9MYCO|nr:short-chain dehydrogenase [Mycolicibacterium anyangense]
MDRLKGQVAIVTGAGQGIGRGIALVLAREGAAVSLPSRTYSRVESVAEEITSAGGTALPIACDVSDFDQLKSAIDRTAEELGAPTILVNNAQGGASGGVPVSLEDTTVEMLHSVLDGGLIPTFNAMKLCLPYMKETGGTIVNMASSTGVDGDPGFSAYGSNKEAIRGLTKHAAREWGKYDITVNVLCPAALTENISEYVEQHPRWYEAIVKKVPLGRLGDSAVDIAPVVVSLATDLRYVTGATLMVDGGRTMLR